MEQLKLNLEYQRNSVADEVSAMIAVVRPILRAILYGLKREVVEAVGGYNKIPLHLLARLHKAGDGDCGISFEYAVHDAIVNGNQMVIDRVYTAMTRYCNISGSRVNSLLFGMEKTGALQLLENARNALTDDSLLMYGTPGPPIKLKRKVSEIARAFRSKQAQMELPTSISGIWKADLFLGITEADKWVGTTVKTKESDLVAERGLRIGIVPALSGKHDKIRKDETRNLIICPIKHDGNFMEIFYRAWGIVRQLLTRDMQMPPEAALPQYPDRIVAGAIVQRRLFSVVEVIDALAAIAQPELLEPRERKASIDAVNEVQSGLGVLITPMPTNL